MEGSILSKFLTAINKVLNVIGGTALTFMMFLTVADVILRATGHPILGTYEIVGLALALVIGFGIPKVSMDRGHVYMEFLIEKCPKGWKNIFNTFTPAPLHLSLHHHRLQSLQRRERVPHVGGSLPHLKAPLLPRCLRGGGLLLHRSTRLRQ